MRKSGIKVHAMKLGGILAFNTDMLITLDTLRCHASCPKIVIKGLKKSKVCVYVFCVHVSFLLYAHTLSICLEMLYIASFKLAVAHITNNLEKL